MPDVRSPRRTMAEENSTPKRLLGDQDRGSPHRGWKCPSDEMIASYLDAAEDSPSRSRLESHLADCEYCRALVAELVKVQRDREMPSLPPGLMQRAVALVPPKSIRMHWLWVPAAAMAGTAFLVIAAVVLRSPEQPVFPAPSAPVAPLIARSERPAPAIQPGSADVVRDSAAADSRPRLIFPKPDKVVARELLKFEWKTVSRARYYELRIATSEGGLVWQGQSEAAFLKLPSDVTLDDGPYFVWISAYLDDGTVRRSAPVRFLVSASREP
jgi:hypothetical protein